MTSRSGGGLLRLFLLPLAVGVGRFIATTATAAASSATACVFSASAAASSATTATSVFATSAAAASAAAALVGFELMNAIIGTPFPFFAFAHSPSVAVLGFPVRGGASSWIACGLT